MLMVKLQGSAKKFVPECLCAAATWSECVTEHLFVESALIIVCRECNDNLPTMLR